MKRFLLLPLCLAPLAVAQFYNISTLAGVGRIPFAGNGGAATNARLLGPKGIAVDAAGNTYVSDDYYQQVFQISASGTITVYAGTGVPGFTGDGGLATAAQLYNPQALAVDSTGNLYICDFTNSKIRKVTPSGTISSVATLQGPTGLDVDAAGNLYVTQENLNVVRMVSPAGAITTIAGTGTASYSGDGGSAVAATLYAPVGVKVDKTGNVFVTDSYNHRIRKITPQGTISTFAGNGTGAFRGDGGSAVSASLFYPQDVAFDGSGGVYISDGTDARLRLVSAAGTISTVAGGGTSLTTSSPLQADLQVPLYLAIDSAGNVVFPSQNSRRVLKLTPQRSLVIVAGALPTPGAGDNVPADTAVLIDPVGVTADSAGNVFIADQGDNRIRKVAPNRIITTVGGNGLFGSAGDNGSAFNAEIGSPRGIGLDPPGNLYVISPINAVVRKITPGGIISRFAGGTGIGFAGDGGPATSALLNIPGGTVGDTQGNVFISDDATARIRRVNSAGTINTYAGTGAPGYSGDNGPALSAQLYRPQQLAVDAGGNLFVADLANNRVRKITPGGTITTVAGTGLAGFTGDGGPATAAQISGPSGLALDQNGNMYISTVQRIRKVDGSTGIITTIAGTGTNGFSGDGGLATQATLNTPQFLAVDGAGNIYVADGDNQRVRQLTPAQIIKEGVFNGATFAAGGVAPGEIITIFGGPGIALGPAAGAGLQLDATGKVATQIGGIQALFDGVAAPLTFVNGSQINAVVPYEVAGKSSTQLQVTIQGKPTNSVTLPVVASSPGVFAITNADGSVNSASNPSAPNGVLVLYATGEGQTNPSVPTGTVNSAVFPTPVLPVSVKIGGQDAFVSYAGAAPGFVAGVLQVNVQIPAGVSGTVPLQLKIGNNVTPAGLTISAR